MAAALPPLLLVMAGGALGAGARYGVGRALAAMPAGWPWGTFAVNLIGGAAMGLLVGLVARADDPARLLLGTGVLGGFTTFSAFSLELVQLAAAGAPGRAAAYALASVAGAAAALWAGLMVARA